MQNKIIFLVFLSLTGCASMYSGWEKVKIVDTVFNKPCVYVTEHSCPTALNPTKYWIDNCYKQVANIDKANTVVINPDGESAKFYNCSLGMPINFDGGEPAWITRNIYNPTATKIDLQKATAECNYQADLATVDTSRDNPTRTYINTNNLYINEAQLHAQRMDSIKDDMHDLSLSLKNTQLREECLKAKGFISTRTADKKDYDDVKRVCPDIDNSIASCFIPEDKK